MAKYYPSGTVPAWSVLATHYISRERLNEGVMPLIGSRTIVGHISAFASEAIGPLLTRIVELEARLAAMNAVVEAARPLRSIRGPMPLTPQTRELFGNLWAALDALDGERSE